MKNSNLTQGEQYHIFKPNYDYESSKIKLFLSEFKSNSIEPDKKFGKKKYMILMQKIANRELSILEIYTEDLESYLTKEDNQEDKNLLDAILNNTRRYIGLFSDAIDELMPSPSKQLPVDEMLMEKADIIYKHRMQNLSSLANISGTVDKDKQNKANNQIPKELTRRYELIIVPGHDTKDHIMCL